MTHHQTGCALPSAIERALNAQIEGLDWRTGHAQTLCIAATLIERVAYESAGSRPMEETVKLMSLAAEVQRLVHPRVS